MKITKNELAKKYKAQTNKDLCKELDISETTLFKILKENGIPMKGKGNKESRKVEVI